MLLRSVLHRSVLHRSAVLRSALLRYVLRRLAIAAGLLLGSTLVGFALVQAVPGDPVAANLSDQALGDPAAVAAFRAKWGLDRPLPMQYLAYLGNLLQGDLGTSQQTGRPVLADLLDHVPATIELVLPAIVLSVVLGTAIGMYAALRQGRAGDQAVRVGALLGLSTPQFWLSVLALYLFFYVLGVSPNGGRLSPQFSPPPRVTGMYSLDALLAGQLDVAWDAVQHIALPVLVLSVVTTATLVRFVRSAILEVLRKDYIAAAYAKGLPARTVLLRHLLRAGLVQIITMTSLAFASMLAGTVLVESVFSWPGVGEYAYASASALDRPAILGVCLFVAAVYIVVNLAVDLLYGVADPRIRLT
ncbi:peptide/nickel transport system permease protein [Thermocatellispora tengchongensis]|uniref:Peptide/nickel transport system permease protein n=1 Tax=Thermocatellispora tengchongensis TaxID=1073253 RepID=A0A840PG29_9ACTN|nr:ABC transporter permease [Thermocatellispora tengchongensis]MBB5136903.1 peptide/nickel transport system permease protein [Thermocatellispora tengchongensis]